MFLSLEFPCCGVADGGVATVIGMGGFAAVVVVYGMALRLS